MKKPVALVTVGLPCSGKSAWAEAHPEKLPIASTDFFIEEYAAEKKLPYAKAFKKHYKKAVNQMKDRVAELVAQKKSFIWDQTNTTQKERDAIYNILHATHDVHFVCFLVPLDVCFERFDKRQAEGNRDGKDVVDKKRIRELAKTTTFPKKGDKCEKIVLLIHPQWPKDAAA